MAGRGVHPVWGNALRTLRRSIYANQILSSVVEEWLTMEALQVAVEKSGVADKVVSSSSLRTMATGHLVRLHFIPGAVDEEIDRLTPLLVQNVYEARAMDAEVETCIQQLREAGALSESWYHLAMLWSRQQRHWLKMTRQALREVIAEDDWMRGQRGAN